MTNRERIAKLLSANGEAGHVECHPDGSAEYQHFVAQAGPYSAGTQVVVLGKDVVDRILALLDEPEPVGYAPWHPDADGTVRGGMLTKDGRLEVYVEEHHCPRDLPYVSLYASPTPTSANEPKEEG